MTNSRRTKKNINKEIMFNKIMPSYLTNTYTEYYSNSNQHSEYRNPKSEPDTFKIREKVLSAMEPRPLVPEEDDDTETNAVRQKPAQANNPAVQKTMVSEDKPKYINITEEILYSKLTNMIAMFKCCNCEKCRQTIMLNVLNNVKPEYVYKKPSEVKELIETNNYVDINEPIIRAILDTKSNPTHKK